MPVPYWEPLLRSQIRELLADGLSADDVRSIIRDNVDAYRVSERPWTGRPTVTDIDVLINGG